MGTDDVAKIARGRLEQLEAAEESTNIAEMSTTVRYRSRRVTKSPGAGP